MKDPNLSRFVFIIFGYFFISTLTIQKCTRSCKIFETFYMKRYHVMTLGLYIGVSKMRISLRFYEKEKCASTMSQNSFIYFEAIFSILLSLDSTIFKNPTFLTTF